MRAWSFVAGRRMSVSTPGEASAPGRRYGTVAPIDKAGVVVLDLDPIATSASGNGPSDNAFKGALADHATDSGPGSTKHRAERALPPNDALSQHPAVAHDEAFHQATSTMHDSERHGERREPPVDRSEAHGESKKEEGERTTGPSMASTVPVVPMDAAALVAEMHADLERLRDASEAHDRARSGAMSRLQGALGSGYPATIRRRFGSLDGGGAEVSDDVHLRATGTAAKAAAASSDTGTDDARTRAASDSSEDHDSMLTAVLGCKAGGDANDNANVLAGLGLFSKFRMHAHTPPPTAPRRSVHHLTSSPHPPPSVHAVRPHRLSSEHIGSDLQARDDVGRLAAAMAASGGYHGALAAWIGLVRLSMKA